MTQVFDVLLNGLGLGAIYGLVALGFTLIFKSTGILNFAHGNFMVLGAFTAFFLSERLGFWGGFFGAALVIGAVGAAAYLLFMRKLAGHGLMAGVMVTIGLSEVLHGGTGILFGFQQRALDAPIQGHPRVELASGVSVATPLVIAAVVLVIAVAVLGWVMRSTLIGVQLRALGQSAEVSQTVGANPVRLSVIVWGIAGVMGAMAGTLLASLAVVDHEIAAFAFRAFTAMIVGGADSLPGALAGGLIVGVVELSAGEVLGAEWRLVSTMILLLLFLIFRPTGLFGSKGLERA